MRRMRPEQFSKFLTRKDCANSLRKIAKQIEKGHAGDLCYAKVDVTYCTIEEFAANRERLEKQGYKITVQTIDAIDKLAAQAKEAE